MAGGRIIKGKYEIIREIGRGAMGIVYEVRHEQLGSTLALKQLQLTLETNEDIARRFRHEARMMARLQHPNIVRVWDIDSEEDFGTFLVMEFINGPDLGKILRTRGRLSYPDALRIGAAVASALHTAHREGLVHRDVKPANILIEEHSMRAVVTDFGIAKQMKGDNEDSTVGTVGFLGTYRYSSPEQIRSERGVSIDGRADIYSLGVVLYEMYSGKKFLEGMSEGQITHLVGFHADWRPTLEYGEPPPDDFRALVERCLVRDRDARIADAGEVVRALESCLRWANDDQRPQSSSGAVHPPPAAASDSATVAATAITQRPAEVAALQTDRRLIEEIDQLQSALAVDVAQLEALHEEWRADGTAPGEGNGVATEDLGRRLAAVDEFKEAADLTAARTTLADLRRDVASRREEQLAGLRDSLARRLRDLREQWGGLAAQGGEFVATDERRAVEHLFDSADRALADDDREATRRAVGDGQRLLEDVATSARTRCATAVGEALAATRTRLRELRERAPSAAAQIEARLEGMDETLRSAVDAGRLRDAANEAQAVSAAVDAAIAATIEDEKSQATAAEQRLRTLLEGFPREPAQAVAPADLAAAQAQHARAEEHVRAGAYREAASAYEGAARGYAALKQRLHQHLATQAEELAEELRTLLARAADAPVAIVGAARQGAQTLLESPRADATAAVPALEHARGELTAALEEAARFASADAARMEAEGLHQRVAELAPSWRQRRRASGAIDKAADAFNRRQWAAALESYGEARQTLGALEQELTGERLSQQAEAARRQLEEVVAGIDADAAAALAPQEYERAEALRRAATDAAPGSADVSVAYERAAVAYGAVAQRVSEQHAAQYAAAQQALQVLVARSESAPDAVVAPERSAAAAMLTAPPPEDLKRGMVDIERARTSLADALDAQPLFTAAGERRATADALQGRVRALGLPRRRTAEAERFLNAAAGAFGRREWAAAREAYDRAIAALTTLEEAAAQQAATSAAQARPVPAVSAAPAGDVVARRPFPYRWAGGAALAAGAVAVVAYVLYPSAPEHRTVQERPAQPTAVTRPTAPAQAKPPAPPPVLPHIAKAVPPAEAVTLREGAQQAFAVVVDGAAPDAPPPIQWKLDDRVVASNVMQWAYAPSYQDARETPRTVSVTLADGSHPEQSHTWRVTVEDVNRGPVLRDASYKPGTRVNAKVGDTLNFRVQAADEDGDSLRYAWKVDGKPAGDNSPDLKLPVTADNQVVSLVVSDGKGSTPAEWRIAALAPFKVEVSPSRLDKLRFNEPQAFAMTVPADMRTAGLRYTWSVDGERVSDAATFTLKDYKAPMVRESPVVIAATARDDQGHSFSHEWKARVIPPVPAVTASAPPTDRTIEAEPNQPLTFTIQASPPLGGQRFTYVYEVDGRAAARDGSGRFTFTPSDDAAHEITGYVEDNFRQTSPQRARWKLQAGTIVTRVQDWLKRYESAWNAKDATAIGRLRGLSADDVRKLEDSFKDKRDLRVSFSGVKTEKVDADRARASYTRLDEWVGKDGEPVSRRRAVEQTFRLAGNQLLEAGESQ